MANNGFELYVDPSKYQQEIDKLNGQISKLQNLASQYENMKNRASQSWGDEDENLQKAQKMCDTAIQIVNQKIKAAQSSSDTLQNILNTAQQSQATMGSALDEGNATISTLLK